MSNHLSSEPKGTILVVDDVPDNLTFLNRMLSLQGYKVRSALNGSLAIKSATIKKPDLILLDILMPDMDGYTICEKLKSDPALRDIPVIFVSALNDALDKVKAFRVGAADYLSKPIEAPEAIARIEHQLNLSRLRQQLIAQNASLIQEIEARRKVEQALQQSCQEVKDIQFALDQSAIVEITDANGKIIYVNDKFCKISKYSREEILGQSHQISKSGHHPPDFFKTMWETLLLGNIWQGEIRNRAKDGSLYWVDTMIIPMLEPDGKPRQYVSIRREVTDRNRPAMDKISATLANWHRAKAEEQLRLLQSVVVNANDSVIITSAQSIDYPGPEIVYVNDAFTRLTGYEADEVIGQTPRILQGPKTNRATLNCIRQALKSEQSIRAELLNYTKTGQEFWVEVNINPLHNDEGVLTHFIAIQRDISQRKQAEAEVLNTLARERELNELKTRFVCMVSHEYRTPLATILSSLELLEHYGNCSTEEEKQEYFQQIRTAVDRMTDLLSDVLMINRSESNLVQIQPQIMNVEQFCQGVVKEIQQTIKTNHHIQLELQQIPISASLDPKILRHIFSNLLSNAVKYTPSGGTIEFKVMCQAQQIVFTVKDSGIGIPPDGLQQLFQSFYRADNVGNIAGTGLGLSIVKRLVELHQGDISVESQVGLGSQFTVTLPYQPQDLASPIAI